MKKVREVEKCGGEDDISLELSVLHNISESIARRASPEELMESTLEMLNSQMGLLRGTITMRDGDWLFIEAAHGMTESQIKRGVYRVGEGITGKVAQTCKSVAILDVAKCGEFLNRTKTRKLSQKTSFICVPVVYMEQAIGTLSIDRPATNETELARDLKLLETIANILADALSGLYLRQSERNALLEENRKLKSELNMLRPAGVVGNSGAMQEVYKALSSAAEKTGAVFMRGKAGTGKELLSRALAEHTPEKTFGVANCAGLSHDGAEIFGFRTETRELREGLLEKYDGGILFFDEVSELSPEVQEKLSRYLKTSKFSRSNTSETVSSKARLVFASAADVEVLVEEGKFLPSLYSEISKNSVHIPSLSDRKSDIILLAEYFLEKYNAAYRKNIRRISTPAINMMTLYPWPGNVRELENCVERAVISSSDSAISGHNLPFAIRSFCKGKNALVSRAEDVDFTSLVRSFERELITEALKENRGNAAAAARDLHITERIINHKIKRYAVTPSWYKA